MKILVLCGVFAKENEAEVIRQAKGGVEFSANLVQQKLIEGFRSLPDDVQVLSAPFIGAYPMRSTSFYFKGFPQTGNDYQYVSFCNLWGIRNFSRAASLKRAVRQFALEDAPDKLIVVYCPHTPFLEAAVYAKKLDSRIRICLYVPDLPGYMNLAEKRSRAYDFFKKYDIAAMEKLMAQVDSFVLLSEQMKDALPVADKPCIVAEGLITDAAEQVLEIPGEEPAERYIVYTGKMNKKFGVFDLIEGFSLLTEPDYRLILCGSGDCDAYAEAACRQDRRIQFLGQVPPEEAAAWQRRASVLVNPRPNNEVYTKYSFPSKNIEYLLSGKPVAACMLDGMPSVYASFLYIIADSANAPQAIADALEHAMNDSAEAKRGKYQAFLRYAREKLLAPSIAKVIVQMTKDS